MEHPLDGARLKVVRAQEHLDALKAGIKAFVSGDSYEIVTENNIESERAIYAPQLREKSQPPLALSMVVGDFLTNARAALDYIMWELARAYFQPKIDLAKRFDKTLSSFPLFGDPVGGPVAMRDRKNCLAKKQVPALALREIEMAQPYNRGYEPLGWLSDLVNMDKHRMLLLTVPILSHVYIHWDRDRTYLLGKYVGSDFPAFSVRSDEMQVNDKLTALVAFKDITMPHEPVDATLEQVIECVANIIPRFDQFFS